MGNVISEEEENELLEEAYSMSLESPEADKVLNQGTSAPNCQPKHTTSTLSEKEDQGQEVVMKAEDGPESEDDGGKSQQLKAKHRRGSSVSDEEDRKKRQHTNGQQQLSSQQQKKLSYFQMAKMGYQELVNAIIRPPRADYKVSFWMHLFRLFRLLLLVRCCCLFLRPTYSLSLLTLTFLLSLFYKDGSLGPPSIYFLWKTIHQNGLYTPDKAWLQSRMLPLGASRTGHG
jgi:hypothetical protein